MFNPQNFIQNYCFSELKSPSKREYVSFDQNQIVKKSFNLKQKKSLRKFRSLKHLSDEQFTRVSRENPQSPQKSLVNELDQVLKCQNPRLDTLKEPIFYSNIILSSYKKIQTYQSPKKIQTILLRAKSLAKVSFTYISQNRNYETPIFQSKHLQKQTPSLMTIQSENNKSTQSDLLELKQKFDALKKEEDQDLRSTMAPLLQIPIHFSGRPKSIISIQDSQQSNDFMNESFILEKHSSIKALKKLV